MYDNRTATICNTIEFLYGLKISDPQTGAGGPHCNRNTQMRAQTTLDFAIGITVFLAAILFVLIFVPGILEPFDTTGGQDPAVSNRIADSLSQGMLGAPEQPHTLDRYCTVQFFDGTTPGQCNYDGDTLRDVFHLGPSQGVNITLLGNVTGGTSKTLCWENETSAGPGLNETSKCSGDFVRLSRGEDPPGRGDSTITARRVVFLYDQQVWLRVIVW